MTQVTWTLVLDTGLPRIDTQHRKLINYSNALVRAIAEGRGASSLEPLFEQLLDYTDTHFADEEAYMDAVGYPELPAHRAAHVRLLNDVGSFREKILCGAQVSPPLALDFVNGWIVHHILVMDSRIGEFVRRRAEG